MRIRAYCLRFIALVFFVLLGFSACKNSQKSQDSQNNTTQQDSPKTYTAMDLNSQEYTITGDLDSLNISPDSNAPTLLVLSALDNSLKDYAPSFNILKKTFKDRLRVLILLNKPYSSDEIKDFSTHFQADFIILNPKDTALFDHLNHNALNHSFNMLLYDKHQLIKMYQGIVPIEMLQFDISNLKD
ncbi:hypothetical protein QCM05_06965 [Helicobacter pylori]|uniref:hypothetical protein n=1 Tax=Helicobacter pylori TaxID=210 RepID=UPI00112E2012|nr:hypothetical protein [Helicobacter pylori]TPH33470.1 hypothetical protein FIM82_03185 [Helicobacter pylori]WGH06702.1 hypothetical protein QCM05_06965 [Helicobacter pylori]GHP50038.1 hypothetical protein VN0224_08220 [Helicobacter pylori]GHR51352.1 hypothetical protein VN1263_06920 [Helicobacter pylori]GHS49383.1 hypothetical protein VN1167_07450 [Helicobacter pylori]